MKLRELHELAAKLEWATYPVAFVLLMLASVGVLLAGQVVGLVRGSRPRLVRDDILRAASGELASAARTAFERMLKPADVLMLYGTSRQRQAARLNAFE